MRRGALILVALAGLTTGTCLADSPPPLIPLPAEIAPGQGTFSLSGATVVRVPTGDAEAARVARYFANKVARTRGLKLSVQPVAAPSSGASSGARRHRVARRAGRHRAAQPRVARRAGRHRAARRRVG